MIVSIHQPSYFPWLGLLNRTNHSDLFVLLDHVDIINNSTQHRNLIYNPYIKPKYLTLPVDHNQFIKINEVHLRNSDWQANHFEQITNTYKKARYYDEIISYIKDFYTIQSYSLIDVIESSMKVLFDLYNIKTKVIRSSSLHCEKKKGEMVLEICQKTGATTHLCGMGAKVYLEPILEKFINNGIETIFEDFKHPHYSQYKNDLFLEGLFGLDMLLFQGIDNSRKILSSIS